MLASRSNAWSTETVDFFRCSIKSLTLRSFLKKDRLKITKNRIIKNSTNFSKNLTE